MSVHTFEPWDMFSRVKNNSIFAICSMLVVTCLLCFACANNSNNQNKELLVDSVDGTRIACGVSGQGETTLVFVHGWLCDHSVWQAQIDHFSRKYRVVWLDLAGHGESETKRQIFSMSAFAQDVKSVCDTLGGERIILVGHSMGGPVVIEAEKLLGEKVVGIIGVEAFYTPLASVPKEIKLGFIEKLKEDYPAALAETVQSMFTQDANPDVVDAMYQSMLSRDHEMGVNSLYECILWNAQKEPFELNRLSGKLYNINAASRDDEKAIHNSVRLIFGAGHFISRVKPREFNAVLEMIIGEYQSSLRRPHSLSVDRTTLDSLCPREKRQLPLHSLTTSTPEKHVKPFGSSSLEAHCIPIIHTARQQIQTTRPIAG